VAALVGEGGEVDELLQPMLINDSIAMIAKIFFMGHLLIRLRTSRCFCGTPAEGLRHIHKMRRQFAYSQKMKKRVYRPVPICRTTMESIGWQDDANMF
jgi:hypothetical protein